MREGIVSLLLFVGFSAAANNYYRINDGLDMDVQNKGRVANGYGKDIIHYIEEKYGGKMNVANNDRNLDFPEDDNINVNNITGVINGTNRREDDERNFIYPCRFSNEEDCIADILSTLGHCVPVSKHKNKERMYRDKAVLYFPSFNLTVTMTDMKVGGLNGKIENFYINRKTRNLVYAVDFQALSVNSRISYFEFHRRGREPDRAADFVNVRYAPTVLTAVIPLDHHGFSLKDARITAFISGLPVYDIGPNVDRELDLRRQQTVVSYTVGVPIAVQEIFLTEANNFFIAYLQNYICDFGIKV